MVALQASIGALNDLVDAAADAGRKPGKPIPAGLVTRNEARLIVGLGAGIGVLLAVVSSPALALLALGILAIGYGYDLLAKGTAWSWLPFAVGIPLLPVFGWLGVAGDLPPAFGILVPVGMAAAAGLAVANARADWERDLDAGLDSVAIRLGPGRAWASEAALLGIVVAVAVGSVWLRSGLSAASVATLGAAIVVLAGVALGRGASAPRRERAWEVEAVGVALLAVAWLAGYGGVR
jgi:4-hydroxybenzoate polyprenyltransferase